MPPLAGDEFSMPAQERVGCDDGGQLVDGLAAQSLALEGQASALVIFRENASLGELFFSTLDSQSTDTRSLLAGVC